MKVYSDLHFHSKYSRAVSPKMELEKISQWANKKGLNLITTTDFTHPLWFKEIKKQLISVREGVYQIKYGHSPVEFIINTEISFIYNNHKIHLLVFAPDIKIAEKINKVLKENKFNLESDGRPILGISPKKFIEMTQKIHSDIFYLPAHVWTPWFSLFGSKSGYDSIKDCFGKYSDLITAVETGLSSDPLMNWQIKELDNRIMVSFSDAHSLSNLGREVTVFNLPDEFTYKNIIDAMKFKNNPQEKVIKTIEFYPEEGKYHYTGHRKCKLFYSPHKTEKLGTTCPICGKGLTVGVAHRVNQLSSKIKIKPKIKFQNNLKIITHPENKHAPFIRLIPLKEVIAEAEGMGPKTKTVTKKYNLGIDHFKNEINLLTQAPISKIAKILGKKIAQGIEKNRLGDLSIQPGYDGLYGKVKIWEDSHQGRGDQCSKTVLTLLDN